MTTFRSKTEHETAMSNSKCYPFLAKGKDNAITHAALKTLTGLDDRGIRKDLESLRRTGTPVINLLNGKGYFLPDNEQDIMAQKTLNHKRAMSILEQNKYLDNALAQIAGNKILE